MSAYDQSGHGRSPERRRANRYARSGFERADRVVVEAFADLLKAHHLKSNQYETVEAANRAGKAALKQLLTEFPG